MTAPGAGGILPTGFARIGEDTCTLVLPQTGRGQQIEISIIAAALSDPRNHATLMAVLRRESRIRGVPLHELEER